MVKDLGGVTPINFNDGGNTVMGVTPVLPPLLVNSDYKISYSEVFVFGYIVFENLP